MRWYDWFTEKKDLKDLQPIPDQFKEVFQKAGESRSDFRIKIIKDGYLAKTFVFVKIIGYVESKGVVSGCLFLVGR